jgi:hypothetical protein
MQKRRRVLPEMQNGPVAERRACVPPSNKEEDRVSQICSMDIAREIERRWERRFHVAVQRAAQNDNRAGDIRPDRVGPVQVSAAQAAQVARRPKIRPMNPRRQKP